MQPQPTHSQAFDAQQAEADIIAALRQVYDPEIPVNVYDLGLIYAIEIDPTGMVCIKMTLTAPNCPEAQNLPASVENAARSVPSVTDVKVELVWEPAWTKDRISEETRLVLGLY